MSLNEALFGPKTESEVEEFAVQDLIFDVQMLLQAKMKSNGVAQAELAKRLSLSAARVSQLFSDDGGNMTLATLAKMAHALSLVARVELESKGSRASAKKVDQEEATKNTYLELVGQDVQVWREYPANHNCNPLELAA